LCFFPSGEAGSRVACFHLGRGNARGGKKFSQGAGPGGGRNGRGGPMSKGGGPVSWGPRVPTFRVVRAGSGGLDFGTPHKAGGTKPPLG